MMTPKKKNVVHIISAKENKKDNKKSIQMKESYEFKTNFFIIIFNG